MNSKLNFILILIFRLKLDFISMVFHRFDILVFGILALGFLASTDFYSNFELFVGKIKKLRTTLKPNFILKKSNVLVKKVLVNVKI